MPTPRSGNPVPQVALIGVTSYGQVYLRYLKSAIARRQVCLVAAVVINRAQVEETCRALEKGGTIIYEDWREMLRAWKDRLDLCMLPVPIHLHKEMTVAALEAGANVLVEKPLAASLAQVEEIREAEQRTGRWVAVGYQDFYTASTIALREQLEAGRIGKIQSVTWSGFWVRSKSYYRRNNWAGRVVGPDGSLVRDSPLNNAMAHFLQLSLYLTGRGANVAAQPVLVEAELFRCHAIESFDTAIVRIQTDTKIPIMIAATHCCATDLPIQLRVIGEKGEMIWTHKHEAVWIREEVVEEKIRLKTGLEATTALFDAVLARLHSPAKICTTEIASAQVACIEAIQSFPIRTISANHYDRMQREDNQPSYAIRNVEADFRQCLRQGVMPTALKLPWAGAIEDSVALEAA